MEDLLTYVGRTGWVGTLKMLLIDQAENHFLYCIPEEMLKYSETRITFLFDPLQREVWATLLLFIVIVGVLHKNMDKSFQVVWVFLNQPLNIRLKGWNPILAVVVYFAVLVLNNMYNGELTSTITAPSKLIGIKSYTELIEKGVHIKTN